MHPAIYAALTDTRETELRRVRRHELVPARTARKRFSIRVALRPRRVATP